MPEAYERFLVPAVFYPFAVDLAVRAARLDPDRILELAAGTGVLTRELVRSLPDVELTATDMNPAMVSLGSRRVPKARWQQGDAAQLGYPDGSFDLVVCSFGVMFFPDKPAAFAEAARVLNPGGRLLFNSWDTVDTHVLAAALVAGLAQAFPDDPPSFLAAVPHGYSNPELIVGDLLAGGLEAVSVERVTLEGRASSASDIAAGFCTGTPLRTAIEARADLATVIPIISDEMTRRLGGGRVSAEMTAHVFEAKALASAVSG